MEVGARLIGEVEGGVGDLEGGEDRLVLLTYHLLSRDELLQITDQAHVWVLAVFEAQLDLVASILIFVIQLVEQVAALLQQRVVRSN